jgi:hypothetical protein
VEPTWWEMPGPARFVEAIVGELRSGRNVVVRTPAWAPPGLAGATRRALNPDGDWRWETLEPANASGGGPPVDVLFDRFLSDTPSDAIRNATTLAQAPAFSSSLVWVQSFTVSTVPQWLAFLSQYGHACTQRSLLERSLFCFLLEGEAARWPSIQDLCVADLSSAGTASATDTQLYVSLLLDAQGGLERRVAASVVSSLALWDPVVAERLARQSLDVVFQPEEVLREMARERGWEDSQASWYAGNTDRFDGQDVLHSAFLAGNGEKSSVQRRVWTGQVGVLLPFVEERRQELLAQLSGVLQVPYKTRFGVVEHLMDLEVGHIESQLLATSPRSRSDLVGLARKLREIRNSLAHQQSVTAGQLMAPALAPWTGRTQ